MKTGLVILKVILLLAMISTLLLLIISVKINLVIPIMLMLENINYRPFFTIISADVFVNPSGRKGKIVLFFIVFIVVPFTN